MVIYLDVVFLISFVMDYLVLVLCAKLLKIRRVEWRVLISAGLGGLFSMASFVIDLPAVIGLPAKLLACGGFVLLGFGFCEKREFLRRMIYFLCVNFGISGIMSGVIALTNLGGEINAIVKNGTVYFYLPDRVFFISLILSYGFVRLFYYFFARRKKLFRILLTKADKTVTARALMDTGNRLVDPVTKRPVIIAEREVVAGFEQEGKLLIPYHSLGNQSGLLEAVKIDRLILLEENQEYEDLLVGITDEKLSKKDDFQVLLHANLNI